MCHTHYMPDSAHANSYSPPEENIYRVLFDHNLDKVFRFPHV